jgi:hypothetical protein
MLMGQFDKENAFILLVARGTLSEAERAKFEELLKAGLQWNYILAQMKRHKLFPLFASHSQVCRIAKNKKIEGVINEVKNNCSESIRRSRILDNELCWIAQLLAEKNITYAVLKGPVLAQAIYDNPSKRTYVDIDILIKKSDADAVTTLLKEQGYIQGRFDKEKARIVPASRKDLLWCSMYTHQLYPFIKVIDQCLLAEVDVQTKFFYQYGNTSENIGNVDFLTISEGWQTLSMIKVNGKKIFTFSWEYFLLQLCLHNYIDEISISKILYEGGGGLRSYCDIRELLTSKRNELNLEKFVKLVQDTGTNKPVYYILIHLSQIYDDMLGFVLSFIEQIRPIDLGFMNEFGHWSETVGEQRGQFSQAFMERIFNNSCQEDYETQRHLFRNPNRAKLH